MDYECEIMTSFAQEDAFYASNKHICTVCEREIYDGEACYCFEGETVCENCESDYVMDHYWYATPKDILLS